MKCSQSVLKQSNLFKFPPFPDTDINPVAAIKWYMSSDAYKLNDKLRKSLPLDKYEKVNILGIDKMLSQLPTYKGSIYRALHFNDKELFSDFINKHKIGNLYQKAAYTSTAKEPYAYLEESVPYKALLKVNEKTGKDISGYGLSGEQEVLFARNTKFKMSNAGMVSENFYFGEMDEI